MFRPIDFIDGNNGVEHLEVLIGLTEIRQGIDYVGIQNQPAIRLWYPKLQKPEFPSFDH